MALVDMSCFLFLAGCFLLRLYSITRSSLVSARVEKRWRVWCHACEQEKRAIESEGTLVGFEMNEWGQVMVRSQEE